MEECEMDKIIITGGDYRCMGSSTRGLADTVKEVEIIDEQSIIDDLSVVSVAPRHAPMRKLLMSSMYGEMASVSSRALKPNRAERRRMAKNVKKQKNQK
jgi:hypothetical protein